MTISKWVDNREMKGSITFSFDEACEAHQTLTQNVVSNELYRLSQKKRIQLVHKGFYAVVPMQFRESGIVPPENYIDQLMKHLGKRYYICLLSAGALLGVTYQPSQNQLPHLQSQQDKAQKPQPPGKLSIMTEPPHATITNHDNRGLAWCHRKEIPQNLLCATNSGTGTLTYSNPELTAVDLVQYCSHIGGLSVATTVLAGLVEKTDFFRYKDELLKATTTSTLQRLGYILECVLHNKKQFNAIYRILLVQKKKFHYRPLSKTEPIDNEPINTKWRLIINEKIKPNIVREPYKIF